MSARFGNNGEFSKAFHHSESLDRFVSLWFFHSTWEFFIYLETSPLPAKGYKFWPIILGTHSHWAVRVLEHATGRPLIMIISGDPWQPHLLLSFRCHHTCWNDLGLSQPEIKFCHSFLQQLLPVGRKLKISIHPRNKPPRGHMLPHSVLILHLTGSVSQE